MHDEAGRIKALEGAERHEDSAGGGTLVGVEGGRSALGVGNDAERVEAALGQCGAFTFDQVVEPGVVDFGHEHPTHLEGEGAGPLHVGGGERIPLEHIGQERQHICTEVLDAMVDDLVREEVAILLGAPADRAAGIRLPTVNGIDDLARERGGGEAGREHLGHGDDREQGGRGSHAEKGRLPEGGGADDDR